MEMNPTEKRSDAELLIANARARTRALKYEYLTAEEQLWRDLAAYLEKAIADLTARNDTIARVTDVRMEFCDAPTLSQYRH